MTQVRQALNEILIETYTLEFDAFGQALLSELEYACQRGLRVRCLIDGAGSQHLIDDHPALFSKLQTEIRIRQGRTIHQSCIIFDRQLGVTGDHPLCEISLTDEENGKLSSRIITAEPAAKIAANIEAAWNVAMTHAEYLVKRANR